MHYGWALLLLGLKGRILKAMEMAQGAKVLAVQSRGPEFRPLALV